MALQRWVVVACAALLFVIALGIAPSAQAATLYWVGGNGDGVTVNANDWNTTNPGACADGAGDAGAVPGASDVAVFDPDCDNNAAIGATWSVAGIDIQSGYAGTVSQTGATAVTVGSSNFAAAGNFTGGSGTIDINGNLTITGGTFTSTSGTLTLSGNLSRTGGTFTHNSGTFTFDGAVAQTLTGETFSALTINNSHGTPDDTNDVDSSAAVTVAGVLTVSDGQFQPTTASDFNGNVTITTNGILKPDASATITVAGNWANTGTFTHNSGTVTFDAAVAQTLTGETFNNLTINNSHASPSDSNDVDSSAAVTVAGTLTVTDGQFQPTTASDLATVSIGANGILKPDASATLTVSGSWTNAGTFTHNSGTVNFDGSSGTQTLTSGGTSAAFAFSALTHSAASTLQLATNALQVDGAFTNSAGTYNANALATTVTGLATVSGGIYTASTATQTFDGGLTISGGTYTGSTGTADVNGALTISSGTFTAPSLTTISGNFSNAGGGFAHNSGQVTLDGTDQSLTGAADFNNFRKRVTSAATLTLPASATQTIAGEFDVQGSSQSTRLSLRSSSTGTHANVKPNGSLSLNSLDLKDIYNSRGSDITCSSDCVDSGNNPGWIFGGGTSGGGGGDSGGGGGGGGGGGDSGSEETTVSTAEKSVKVTALVRISAADRAAADFIENATVPAVVERLFSSIFGRTITPTESTYWKARARSDKATESALKGAMAWHKAKGSTGVAKTTVLVPNASDKIISVNVPLVVETIFQSIFGRSVTTAESTFWKARARSDKPTESGLTAAMLWHYLMKRTK